MRYATFGLILWFTCGFFAWGVSLGEVRNSWLREGDDCRHQQVFMAMWGEFGGPLALGIALATSGFAENGLQWTCANDAKGENNDFRIRSTH